MQQELQGQAVLLVPRDQKDRLVHRVKLDQLVLLVFKDNKVK